MQLDTLHYSEKQNLLYFDSKNPNVAKIHNARRVPSAGGFVWAFPIGYPDDFISLKDFKAILPDGQATPSALAQIEDIRSIPKKIESLDVLNSLNFNYKCSPMLHQMVALEFMFHYPRLALLMAMGLGKTYVSLMHIALEKFRRGRPYKALILAPKIVLRNWYEETLKFTDLIPVLYRGTPAQRAKIRQRIIAEPWDLIITNYEAVVARKGGDDYKLFKMDIRPDVVFMDEGSRLRGHDAQRTKAVQSITAAVDRRYVLSGALSLGKPDDLFKPFQILNPVILGTNFIRFRNKYCEISKYNRHVVVGYKNLDHLKNQIDPYVLIQHRDDCIDLPTRTFVKSYYELSSEQVRLYNEIVNNEVVYAGPENEEMHVELSVVKLTKLAQVLSGFLILPYPRNDEKCNNRCPYLLECIRENIYPWEKDCPRFDPHNRVPRPAKRYLQFKQNPKLEHLLEQIEDSGDERLIIWANYRKELDHISSALRQRKIKFITPDARDSDVVFRQNPDIKVYLGQVSQGIGTTLNDARVMYFYSNSLDLEDRIQSLERNYRIGQTQKVVVKDLVAPGTIEPALLRLLDGKENVKDFFQSKVECVRCEKSMHCFERGIIAYSNECLLADIRKDAEIKRMIRIKELRSYE